MRLGTRHRTRSEAPADRLRFLLRGLAAGLVAVGAARVLDAAAAVPVDAGAALPRRYLVLLAAGVLLGVAAVALVVWAVRALYRAPTRPDGRQHLRSGGHFGA